jgi:hypothetical protein
MSALCPKADVGRTANEARFGPKRRHAKISLPAFLTVSAKCRNQRASSARLRRLIYRNYKVRTFDQESTQYKVEKRVFFRRRKHMRTALQKIGIAAAVVMIAGITATLPSVAYAQHHHGGHGWGGHARGWGWGGFAAGALLGGLLAAPYYYAPGPYYYYEGPGYYGGDAVRYCLQRFKSYDPRSGTYLGYDGYRHPCP